MSVTFATKPVAGKKTVLRPAPNVTPFVVSLAPYELEHSLDAVSPSKDEVIRTNLDGTVVVTKPGYRRIYEIEIRVVDELPQLPFFSTGGYYDKGKPGVYIDRFRYVREGALEGVYLRLDLTTSNVASAEGALRDVEAITASDDRTLLLLPAQAKPVIEREVATLRALKDVDNDYAVYRGDWTASLKRAVEGAGIESYVQRNLVQRAILALVDAEEFASPFTIKYYGKPVDESALREAAHAEALEYVAAERARLNQYRYELTLKEQERRQQLVTVLERIAENAQRIAEGATTLAADVDAALAVFAVRETRPGFDAVAGIHWDKTPERLAESIGWIKREHAEVTALPIRSIVLPGEE